MRISSRAFVLTLSMCANLYFAFLLHRVEDIKVQVTRKVDAAMVGVSTRGFQIGCEVSAQGIGHHSPDDVDWSLVQDWCRHNANFYAPKK